MLFNYISQVTNEENLFNNQNFSLTDHFLSSHDQGEILCWSMEGLKGEGLKKKKQLLSNRWLLATDDLMRKHCQLINVDVDVDDSSALT